MDQNMLKQFVAIVWGALWVYLGIIAAVCLLLILRYRALYRPRRFHEEREVEANAPWRERMRTILRLWRPRRS